MPEVKICGVRDAPAMDAVAEAGADWAGFVLFPPSPRFLTAPDAARLIARHPHGPRPVALLVAPTDEDIAAALAAAPFAVLQVYASADRAADIQARFGVPVWLAAGVAAASDLPAAAQGVTRLLLDHKPPPAAPLPGGNAASFDWTLLAGWRPPAPWVLAGGLTPANVAEAIRHTSAPAVDVSSGVERVRGVKDPALIAAFVAAARARASRDAPVPA